MDYILNSLLTKFCSTGRWANWDRYLISILIQQCRPLVQHYVVVVENRSWHMTQELRMLRELAKATC
jgi:hypothetical protein